MNQELNGTNMRTKCGLPLFGLAVAMLLSPAPVQARYADGMHLYQYVRSRPTRFVDPAGLKVTISVDPPSDHDAKRMKKDLTDYLKTICDKASVDDKSGDVSVGDMTGSKTPKGCCCLKALVDSKNPWSIVGQKMTGNREHPDKGSWPGTDGSSRTAGLVQDDGKPGAGTGGTIYTPTSGGESIWQSGDSKGKMQDAPNWRVLAHELCGHAFHLDNGTHVRGEGKKNNRPEHDQAIGEENAIAGEHAGQIPRGTWQDPGHGESDFRPGKPE